MFMLSLAYLILVGFVAKDIFMLDDLIVQIGHYE
jgi:hypothetical protein